MARVANPIPFVHSEDIDPSSSQLIGLYIKTSVAPYDGPALFTPSPSPIQRDDSITKTIGLLAENLAWRSTDIASSLDTTKNQILRMTLPELQRMQYRVDQLAVSTRGLLKKIYGDQLFSPQLIWITADYSASRVLDGAEESRVALHEHYRRLMEITRQPVIAGLHPASHEGVQLLQEYCSRLVMLAQERNDQSPVTGASEHALLRQRPGSRSGKIDKASNRHRSRFGSFDASPRSPVECSATLTEYQRQLSLLEQENQRRLGESTILEYNSLTYDEQLAVLKARHEKRLRLKGSKHSGGSPEMTQQRSPPLQKHNSSEADAANNVTADERADWTPVALPEGHEAGKGNLPVRNRTPASGGRRI